MEKKRVVKPSYIAAGLILVYIVLAICTILVFKGTGDSGDSIQHYLYSKYALEHPANFFKHWAKPFFVLLSFPFALQGFGGMKVFNVLCAVITFWFCYQTARTIKIKNSVLVIVLLMGSPLYYILTFSGLTEPLFSAVVAISFYLIVKKNFFPAAILISFMPFIRSEGYIVMAVFGLYFLMSRQWKVLPLFLFGNVVYAVAGYFFYDDLLWVFNETPYTKDTGYYGSGKLFHFAEQLIYVCGIPVYVLMCAGILSLLWKLLRRMVTHEELIVLFGFLSFFVAHTLFWYLGIFNSLGLKRVFIAIMPFIGFLALFGFNACTELLGPKKSLFFKIPVIVFILVFPFTDNPAAINFKKDMELSADQIASLKVASFIKTNYPASSLVFAPPYLSEALDVDFFDPTKRRELTSENLDVMKKGDLVIWEDGFSVTENKMSREYMEGRTDLERIQSITEESNGRKAEFVIYKKIR